MFLRPLVFVAALCLLALSAARADDWPQYRGPKRDGVWRETGIMRTFPAGGLKAAWRIEGGPGFASPVAANDRVYLFHSVIAGGKAFERVQCIDWVTGTVKWTHNYDAGYKDWALDPKSLAGPNATPVVEGEQIYTLGQMGHVFCLDAIKGGVLWQRDLAKDFAMKEFAGTPSPVIEGDLLILVVGGTPGATVVALDKRTGKDAWKALDEKPTHSSPVIVEDGDKRQLIIWTQDSVTALNPANGKTYWQHKLGTMGDYAVATPVCDNGLMLIGGLMLEMKIDKPGVAVLWPDTKAATKRIFSNTSTAFLNGEHLYSARSTGELVCIKSATGEQVWEVKTVTDSGNGASIHITPNGDAAFLYTNQGELIRATLSPRGYEETARSKIIEPTYTFGARKVAWAPPAYANRCVFVRNDAEMVCVSLAALP